MTGGIVVPTLSRFYGIEIVMYPRDHNPPHFHAFYSGHEAVVGISPIQVTEGALPSRAASLVLEWTALHQADLLRAWGQRTAGQRIEAIAPLP